MKNSKLNLEAEISLQKIQKIHDVSHKIAFYAERASDWNHYSNIIDELINVHKIDIYYITSDSNDPLLLNKNKNIFAYYIGYDDIRTVFFQTLQFKVFVTTTPDLGKFNFTRSPFDVHYAYVFSSLVSAHIGYMHDAFDNYDSVLCLGPHQHNELKALEQHYGLKQKEIVDCGYGHLENIINSFKKETKNIKKNQQDLQVVIAPTYGQNSLLEIDNGELCFSLFDILSKANIEVTLRPHWMTINNNPSLISLITERQKNCKTFKIEKDLSSIDSLINSDILISDFSGVALEFAFGFLKPVVYIDVPLRSRNAEFNEINLPAFELKLRSKTGKVISPEKIKDLPNIIKNLYSNDSFQMNLVYLRDKTVFNLGTSGEVGANYLSNLIIKKNIKSQKINLKKPISLFTASNASVEYPNGVIGMQTSDFKIYDGELTVLIGPSGAGKSTMLRTLNGLVPLSTGSITTKEHGQLNKKKSWQAHQRRTAMIFQQHQLIGRQSALHNVLLGRVPHHGNLQCLMPWSKKDKFIALEALDRVGLLNKSLERVSNLSGGEMQRVGIARALTQEPTVILADEPVASLDPAISVKILSLLNDICIEKSITAIVSLHQVDLAKKFANRLLGIAAGKIIFEGKAGDLTFEILRNLYGENYSDNPEIKTLKR
ncbi:ATP-binding cassette domain-containing protein [Pelagibacterales bacterium]|nr:ATP-binding cassette domain-containing protein [Pelagibacterales bacterium]